MDKRSAGTFYSEKDSSFKEFGRYSSATAEYSTLVVGSLLQRGAHSVKNGASAVAESVQRSGQILKQTTQQVVAPLKRLGSHNKEEESEACYAEKDSSFKEFGRYSSATVEYSTLVAGSLLQRGVHSVKNGASVVAIPFKKSGQLIKQTSHQVAVPVKYLGGQLNKMFDPFRWVGRKLAYAGNRGLPVHLDRDTLGAIQQGLSRIEDRLARIEEKGISFAQAPRQPNADDFKEKPTKEKSMLFRAILEESKETLGSATSSE